MKGGKNLEEWVDRLLALATSSSRDLGRTAADSWWILLGRVFTDDSFQPIRFSRTVYPELKHQLKTQSRRYTRFIRSVIGNCENVISSEII